MLINKAFLQETIEVVQDINYYYGLLALDSRTNIKSTDYLRDVCEQNLNKKIVFRIHRHPHENSNIKGFYFSLNNETYEIVILSGLNYCWTRLVLCKELFHVVLDKEVGRHATVNGLLQDVSAQLNVSASERPEPSIPIQTEPMAEIAAMEFLFPYEERLKKINCHKPNFAQIAEQYKVPKRYVELYLSDSFMIALKGY